MKTLENNISYKIYSNGEEFIKENHAYLNATLQTSIEASFFLLNAQNYHELNRNNYALQFKKEDEILLILKLEPFNMLLFGSKNLCDFAANRIADLNLAVENVLGEEECTTYFLKCYQNRFKGDIVLQHSMQIMILSKQIYTPSALVFQCGSKDLKELAVCYCSFKKEALSEELEFSVALELLKGKEHTYYAIKDQGKIVSIAAKARNSDSICAISNVFTMPEYRKKGYAKQVVSKLAKDILDEGKKPYLYVDSTNPISNHLYLNLGFTYLPRHQIQYHYQPKTIKKAIFAG
ncbi:MAG: GNAT family N-acetyltransferase, partial [Anaeroplasmataceae bacterium]|nr:GNAT family N-acetyltransferase [Anaeroplasmataceae bacterium]